MVLPHLHLVWNLQNALTELKLYVNKVIVLQFDKVRLANMVNGYIAKNKLLVIFFPSINLISTNYHD